MKEKYWYDNAKKLIDALRLDTVQGAPYWVPFMTVKDMIGEVCIEELPDGNKHLEVVFYHLDPASGVPSAVGGDLVPSSLSFQWNNSSIGIHWNSCHILDLGSISFNRFRMIMDNIDIYDYYGEYSALGILDGEILDPYEEGNAIYNIKYTGVESTNWFNILR